MNAVVQTERFNRPGNCGALPARLALFDRYRPAALAAMCRKRPFNALLKEEWFCELALGALPDFLGDATDVAAQLDENMLNQAVETIEPINGVELDEVFPALARIADALELTLAERMVLAFLAQLPEEYFWQEWDAHAGPFRGHHAALQLAMTLLLDPREVKRMFNPGGRLVRSGLLDRGNAVRGCYGTIAEHFPLMEDLDPQALRSPEAWKEFLSYRFDRVSLNERHFDFPHLEEHCSQVCDCLEKAMRDKSKGIHILLYGPPGTGKTTLARELACRLGAELYEVRKEFQGGFISDGELRLNHYNLGQQLGAARDGCLVLFDELEDLLPASPRNSGEGTRLHKGWICESLENAGIPTLWTGNSLDGIDPAILRRFTFTLEVGVPPRSFRRKLLDQSVLGRNVSAPWLERTASLECLTPAMTEQLGSLAASLSCCGLELEAAMDLWLSERLKAMGQRPLLPVKEHSRFRSDLLNTVMDPERIIAGLRQSGEGRLCLYGPPGTGKTAFANYLAEQLDMEAQIRRGSDLRSAYVGETERNIARMFNKAGRNSAVLILDEADSFLSSRTGRHQRWQMNEVSEFLVQLESFRGILCATTNRFEDLDPAFMRRFDMKIELDYLATDQRVQMFKSTLRSGGCVKRLKASTRSRLDALGSLTPGDFITAQRRLRFSGQELTQEALLSALVHEVECKQVNNGRPIGFRWAS